MTAAVEGSTVVLTEKGEEVFFHVVVTLTPDELRQAAATTAAESLLRIRRIDELEQESFTKLTVYRRFEDFMKLQHDLTLFATSLGDDGIYLLQDTLDRPRLPLLSDINPIMGPIVALFQRPSSDAVREKRKDELNHWVEIAYSEIQLRRCPAFRAFFTEGANVIPNESNFSTKSTSSYRAEEDGKHNEGSRNGAESGQPLSAATSVGVFLRRSLSMDAKKEETRAADAKQADLEAKALTEAKAMSDVNTTDGARTPKVAAEVNIQAGVKSSQSSTPLIEAVPRRENGEVSSGLTATDEVDEKPFCDYCTEHNLKESELFESSGRGTCKGCGASVPNKESASVPSQESELLGDGTNEGAEPEAELNLGDKILRIITFADVLPLSRTASRAASRAPSRAHSPPRSVPQSPVKTSASASILSVPVLPSATSMEVSIQRSPPRSPLTFAANAADDDATTCDSATTPTTTTMSTTNVGVQQNIHSKNWQKLLRSVAPHLATLEDDFQSSESTHESHSAPATPLHSSDISQEVVPEKQQNIHSKSWRKLVRVVAPHLASVLTLEDDPAQSSQPLQESQSVPVTPLPSSVIPQDAPTQLDASNDQYSGPTWARPFMQLIQPAKPLADQPPDPVAPPEALVEREEDDAEVKAHNLANRRATAIAFGVKRLSIKRSEADEVMAAYTSDATESASDKDASMPAVPVAAPTSDGTGSRSNETALSDLSRSATENDSIVELQDRISNRGDDDACRAESSSTCQTKKENGGTKDAVPHTVQYDDTPRIPVSLDDSEAIQWNLRRCVEWVLVIVLYFSVGWSAVSFGKLFKFGNSPLPNPTIETHQFSQTVISQLDVTQNEMVELPSTEREVEDLHDGNIRTNDVSEPVTLIISNGVSNSIIDKVDNPTIKKQDTISGEERILGEVLAKDFKETQLIIKEEKNVKSAQEEKARRAEEKKAAFEAKQLLVAAQKKKHAEEEAKKKAEKESKELLVAAAPGLTIDELAGNVASQDDRISIASVSAAAGTAEPWLTLNYDEWICVTSGEVVIVQGEGIPDLHVTAGKTVHIEPGVRFKPVFPVDTQYVPVCLPAFKPESCIREDGDDTVGQSISTKLKELHSAAIDVKSPSCSNEDPKPEVLFHMTTMAQWMAAKAEGGAYYPTTFEVDGFYTHATGVPSRLITTANHFYQSVEGPWVCLEFTRTSLKRAGIFVRDEEALPVGETAVNETWSDWVCPHIIGGIPIGVVDKEYLMVRDGPVFVSIEGL